jgi:hypothetical protein
MNKIASPGELQAELRRLLAYSQSEKPSREKLAAGLNALADRVAGAEKETVPESDQGLLKDQVRRNKGKYHGPNGLKSGQKYKYQGKDWYILDFDAESKAPGGSTLYLVSADFKETVRGVEVAEKKASSVGRVAYNEEPDIRVRQVAYSKARSMMKNDDLFGAPLRKAAKAYFDALDKTAPESVRHKLAVELIEELEADKKYPRLLGGRCRPQPASSGRITRAAEIL